MKQSIDMKKNQPRNIVVMPSEAFIFYLQHGWVCSPEVMVKQFNEERISDIEFPTSLRWLSEAEFRSYKLGDEEVALKMKSGLPKKKSIIPISYIECAYVLSGSLIKVQFRIKNNDLNFGLRLLEKEKLMENILQTGEEIDLSCSKQVSNKLLNVNRYKGGLAAVRAMNLEDKSLMQLCKDFCHKDFGGVFWEKGMLTDSATKSFMSGNYESHTLFDSLKKSMLKNYGKNANELVKFLGERRQQDNTNELLNLLNDLRNNKSEFSLLIFLFLLRKHPRLKNLVTDDSKNLIYELMTFYYEGCIQKEETMKAIFLMGYHAGYASLNTFNLLIDDENFAFAPRLDDHSGSGDSLNKHLLLNLASCKITGVYGDTVNESEVLKRDVGLGPKSKELRNLTNEVKRHFQKNSKMMDRSAQLLYLIKVIMSENDFFNKMKKALELRPQYEIQTSYGMRKILENSKLEKEEILFYEFIIEFLRHKEKS